MTDVDVARFREAWRRASPCDIATALKHPEGYSAEVIAVVREEAQRRGLEPPAGRESRALDSLKQAGAVLARLAGPVCGCAQRHTFVAGLVLGVLCAVGGVLFGGFASPVIFLALYVGGLLVICWPLRRYRPAVIAPLAAWLGFTIISLTHLYAALRETGPIPAMSRMFVVGQVVSFAILFAGGCVLLSAAVYNRNLHWPVHHPGHCRVCGYNLRGLLEPRCPECGTPCRVDDVSCVESKEKS